MGAVLLVLILLAVAASARAWRRAGAARAATSAEGLGARRFFHYLLLLGLLVVAATGCAGLLSRVLDTGRAAVESPAGLALDTAFTVVGVPLYAWLAWWTRGRFAADPSEQRSVGWAFYLTAASIISLVQLVSSLHAVLSWAVGTSPLAGRPLGALVVWGAAWWGHWFVDRRLTGPGPFTVHRLIGSVLGLGLVAVGIAALLADAIEALLGLPPDVVLAAGGEDMLLPGVVLLATGLPVWLVYWVLPVSRYQRGTSWLVQVLLVGVAGGLVTAITAASIALFDVLVWLVGEPSTPVASIHLSRVPESAATFAVGILVWWYHRLVLQSEGIESRTEVKRVYEYVVAGIGLVAAAVGVVLILVAAVSAVAGPTGVILGGRSALNTVLGAATLLVVGGPVWWVFWRRIEIAARAEPEQERASTVRRIYVVILFGVAGLAAVVALLVLVYLMLQDVFRDSVSSETLRSVRYPLGVIVTAGLVSAYHWTVYRADRQLVQATQRGPRYVLLVGRADPDIARALSRRTGGEVQLWSRTDTDGPSWSLPELESVLLSRTEREVVVVQDGDTLRVLPVDRAPALVTTTPVPSESGAAQGPPNG